MMHLMAVLISLAILLETLLIRDFFVSRFRVRAINEVSTLTDSLFQKGDYSCKKYYDHFDNYGSYNKMLFDFRKWKYRQFYPDGWLDSVTWKKDENQ